ncbi:tRNA synthetases class I, catalytic domain-containing protein [Bombardia bombarda]|uniref:glutamine--tRNA ligase n=1 Tax=Bombardia bombarda TaxID=252184 RepID=A0AA39WAL5_9PEZI|nr:tRNA synthetases class I, catalytic domain-containing protein [Bombardia bombarda]
MAEATNQTVRLQLDEETGEIVSKNELKKRIQKRAKKASLQGFLAEVFKLRPVSDVVTRFPPEPNGYLHLGHSKAIVINFGSARYHGGKTILRFDDTNLDAEKEEYFAATEETIRWLGFTPSEIIYASDNFQRMYDLAEELIKKGKAYVCHCDEAETKLQRGGEDGSTPRPTSLNIAAYRIPKDQSPHFRTGDALCTTEFIMSRESYEWLNQLLVVRGWDGPHRGSDAETPRRRIPPRVYRRFTDIKRFEQSVRWYLEKTVPRLMLILDPPLVIEDAEEQDLDIPFSPKDPSMGTHKIRLTKRVFIDRSDFREVDSDDYYRLAPGKTVGLLQMPYPVKAVSFTKDEAGAIKEVQGVFDKEGTRPKTYIQWVPKGSPTAEVRSETIWPNALVEDGFYEVRDRAPWPEADGEKAKPRESAPEGVQFQAIRAPDSDSTNTDDKIVLNRIVPLKEDSVKSGWSFSCLSAGHGLARKEGCGLQGKRSTPGCAKRLSIANNRAVQAQWLSSPTNLEVSRGRPAP